MTSDQRLASPLVGLFVGGKARRFGGIAKGLLRAPDGRSIVERTIAVVRSVAPDARLVLVGDASPYQALGLDAIADSPPGIGPLGGLSALLNEAEGRGLTAAVALACDMPFVSGALVRKLCELEPNAPVLAPRPPGQRWYALSARYAVSVLPVLHAMIAEREHKLQSLFVRVSGARVLQMSEDELGELHDWDRPEDVR